MRKLFLLLLLAIPGSLFAQGSFVPLQTATKTVAGFLAPAPLATITVCAAGSIGTPCSPALANTVFSDTALTQSKANPFQADSSGNYQFAVAPGTYTVTVTGTGVTGYSYQVSSSGQSGTISLGLNQIGVGTGSNNVGGSNGFTFNGNTFSITNLIPANGGTNQNSPLFSPCGNDWSGSASFQTCWGFQIVPGTGSNPVDEYRITGGSSSGGQLFHVKTAFTADGQGNFGSTLATQNTIFTAPIQGTLAYQNKGNTAATNVVNVSSGTHQLVSEFWNGAASADDTWTYENVLGSGTNPTSTMSFVHSGSPGQVIASIPGIMYSCGTIAAGGACVPATSGNSHCFSGIATLAGGTSVITAITPAFTSSSSYFVVTTDLTTIANPSKGVPASGSSITFTGTGTDNLSFIACGQ